MVMTYIVEYIEAKTERFRAVRVECEDPQYILVDLMKQHSTEPLKLVRHYPATKKPETAKVKKLLARRKQ